MSSGEEAKRTEGGGNLGALVRAFAPLVKKLAYTEGELKMKAKVFTRIIYVIVAGIFLFSAGKLIYHYGDSYLSEKEFDDLKTNNQYKLKQLKKKNKDLVGRIKIKGTKIDYPVMQTAVDRKSVV